jgi:hypothetical protein
MANKLPCFFMVGVNGVYITTLAVEVMPFLNVTFTRVSPVGSFAFADIPLISLFRSTLRPSSE